MPWTCVLFFINFIKHTQNERKARATRFGYNLDFFHANLMAGISNKEYLQLVLNNKRITRGSVNSFNPPQNDSNVSNQMHIEDSESIATKEKKPLTKEMSSQKSKDKNPRSRNPERGFQFNFAQ